MPSPLDGALRAHTHDVTERWCGESGNETETKRKKKQARDRRSRLEILTNDPLAIQAGLGHLPVSPQPSV